MSLIDNRVRICSQWQLKRAPSIGTRINILTTSHRRDADSSREISPRIRCNFLIVNFLSYRNSTRFPLIMTTNCAINHTSRFIVMFIFRSVWWFVYLNYYDCWRYEKCYLFKIQQCILQNTLHYFITWNCNFLFTLYLSTIVLSPFFLLISFFLLLAVIRGSYLYCKYLLFLTSESKQFFYSSECSSISCLVLSTRKEWFCWKI